MKKVYLVLFAILLIAGFLRFYQLGSNPPSLNWDEASWGYNAYSLGIDGKDEFGKLLPDTYLESFGDYKPPLYAYLDVLPVKLLGLNELATRLPSALFGILAVLFTFFLVRRIFYKSGKADSYALAASFFLAISPWHILLSRAAFEANVASFFIIFGAWAFLAAVQDKKWYLILSAVSFALSFYIFNTARVVSPILVMLLAIMFRKRLFQIKVVTILAVIVGFLVFMPIFRFLLTPQAGLRFQEVNIFSDTSIVKTSNQEIVNDGNVFWSKIIHNRRFLYGLDYLQHYFDNLNPNFLFITGDNNPKFSTQTVGQMYIWDIPFFVLGILMLFRKREGKWWLVPLWLLIGIIPAALARETPHALRIENSLPMFQVLVAYGFIEAISLIKSRKKEITGILLLLLTLNFLYFYHDYFSNYKYDYSGEWQYGYKQSIDYVKSVENNYDYIQVSNTLGRPYIYYLFYTKTDPKFFRQTANITRDVFGFVYVNSFGKYIFPQNFNYSLSSTNKKVLYINSPDNLPKKAKILQLFYWLNGTKKLVAYTL